MAKFALDRLKAKQAIVMTDVKQDYSVGLTDAIRHYFSSEWRQNFELRYPTAAATPTFAPN